MLNIYSLAFLLSFTAGAERGSEKSKTKSKCGRVQGRRPPEPRSPAGQPVGLRGIRQLPRMLLTPPHEAGRPRPPVFLLPSPLLFFYCLFSHPCPPLSPMP